MSYAKIDLDTGRLIFPPSMLRDVELTFLDENGEPVTGRYNVGYDPAVEPRPEVVAYLLGLGYLPVVEAPRPDDGEGYHYEADYTENNGEIVQSWELVDDPVDPDPEIDAERALQIILTGVDNYETE